MQKCHRRDPREKTAIHKQCGGITAANTLVWTSSSQNSREIAKAMQSVILTVSTLADV